MRPFRYQRADDVASAVAAVRSTAGATFLAGGTNLLDLMKLGVEQPSTLVDVSRALPAAIERTAQGGLRIGAGVRNSHLAAEPAVRVGYPALAQAVLAGASAQLRNIATVGGNLHQRPRCAYFQDVTKPCNRRLPGSGCPAATGAQRELAILGASPSCVAVHPSDLAVALTAFDATVRIHGGSGERTIPLHELYALPSADEPRFSTLERGDLIVGVELPALPLARRSTYRKVRGRASFAFGLVSVAAAIEIVDGVVRDARVAFGAVAPRPWRAAHTEDGLRGQIATEQVVRRAVDAELAGARPGSGYKVRMLREVTVRSLCELAGLGS